MFCSRCGSEIADEARFCPKCGHEVIGRSAPQTAVDASESSESSATTDTAQQNEMLQTLGDRATIGVPHAADVQAILQPGRTFAGRYEIQGLLGRGGMGAVYEAHDTVLKEPVALKILLPELTENPKAADRFLREARISRQLSHKNIVRVHDVLPAEAAEGLNCISMERIEGANLREFIESRRRREKQLSVKEVLLLARQICDAMQYAHETTVHRDLKPENILIGRDGKVKVSDFGIASLVRKTGTATTSIFGTAYYMAPEQTRSGADVDRRADVYALGVILYEALVGNVPMGRFQSPRELRNDVPVPMDRAIMAALATDPGRRPPSMREFYDRLSQQQPAGARKSDTYTLPSSPVPTGSPKSAPAARTTRDPRRTSQVEGRKTGEDQSRTESDQSRKQMQLLIAVGGGVGLIAILGFVLLVAMLGDNERQHHIDSQLNSDIPEINDSQFNSDISEINALAFTVGHDGAILLLAAKKQMTLSDSTGGDTKVLIQRRFDRATEKLGVHNAVRNEYRRVLEETGPDSVNTAFLQPILTTHGTEAHDYANFGAQIGLLKVVLQLESEGKLAHNTPEALSLLAALRVQAGNMNMPSSHQEELKRLARLYPSSTQPAQVRVLFTTLDAISNTYINVVTAQPTPGSASTVAPASARSRNSGRAAVEGDTAVRKSNERESAAFTVGYNGAVLFVAQRKQVTIKGATGMQGVQERFVNAARMLNVHQEIASEFTKAVRTSETDFNSRFLDPIRTTHGARLHQYATFGAICAMAEMALSTEADGTGPHLAPETVSVLGLLESQATIADISDEHKELIRRLRAEYPSMTKPNDIGNALATLQSLTRGYLTIPAKTTANSDAGKESETPAPQAPAYSPGRGTPAAVPQNAATGTSNTATAAASDAAGETALEPTDSTQKSPAPDTPARAVSQFLAAFTADDLDAARYHISKYAAGSLELFRDRRLAEGRIEDLKTRFEGLQFKSNKRLRGGEWALLYEDRKQRQVEFTLRREDDRWRIRKYRFPQGE